MNGKQGHEGPNSNRDPERRGARAGHSGGERKGRSNGERDRRRNERGQYVEEMTKSEILDLFERVPGPVIATTDVAKHFDSTTEGARRKLNDLCDDNLLDRRKVGGTSVYWRREETGR